MERFLETAKKSALLAGEFLLQNLGKITPDKAEEKKLNDFVSYVDRGSEEIIRRTIKDEFPEHAFLGEEEGQQGENPFLWIVDPLDGTKNYLHQFPMFGISIALKREDEVVLGLVYEPLRKDMIYAIKGKGAFRNGNRIHIVKELSHKKALIATAFPFREKGKFPQFLEAFREIYYLVSDIRRGGVAALDLAYTGAGIFSAFYEYGLSIWDIAAGSLIVIEAGGVVLDFEGGEDYLATGNIVAGEEKLVQKIVEILKKYF